MAGKIKMHTKRKKININDIAKCAGVGASTVSRILRGVNNVSTETRDKILKVVQELGYDAQKHCRSIINERQKRVFINLPHGTLEDSSSSFFHQIYLYLVNYLVKEGYTPTTGELPEGEEWDYNSLGHYGSIIFFRYSNETNINKAMQKFPQMKFCSVSFMMDNTFSVNPNELRGAELLAEHLVQKGIKNVMVLEDRDNRAYRYRSSIFSGAFQFLAPEASLGYLQYRDICNSEEMEKIIENYLNKCEKLPEAFFCPRGWDAEILYNLLKKRNILVPKDVSICCFDRPTDGYGQVMPFPYVDFDLRDMAKACVFLLKNTATNIEYYPEQILIPVVLHDPEKQH